jgi:hypothetical protein
VSSRWGWLRSEANANPEGPSLVESPERASWWEERSNCHSHSTGEATGLSSHLQEQGEPGGFKAKVQEQDRCVHSADGAEKSTTSPLERKGQ